jgi:WD40 repeat protein
VKVAPDGHRAISWSEDKTLRVWDLDHGTELATLKGHKGDIYSVAITPDGHRAISGSNDSTLKVWDLKHGTKLATLWNEFHLFYDIYAVVDAVAVTPDGRRAVSGSSDDILNVWDLKRGTKLATLKGHEGIVDTVAVTPDGRRAVSGARDGTLKVWDLLSYKLLATFSGDYSINACAVAPDGLTIAVDDSSERVYLLHLENAISDPPIVTAWQKRVLHLAFWRKEEPSLPAFCCPHCRNWSEVPTSALGKDLPCAICGKQVKLNTFTIDGDWRPIAKAWKVGK